MGITTWGDEAPLRLPPPDSSKSSPLGQLPPAPARNDEDDENRSGSLDSVRLRELLGFPLRSVYRHRVLVALVFAMTMGAAGLAAALLPRTYHVDTRILAQRNGVMLALGNPRRAVPLDADSPLLLAKDVILSRENIGRLIVQTNLLERWEQIRPAVGRWKEQLLSRFTRRPPSTRAERMDQLVDVLLKAMWVVTGSEGSDGTVTISIDWVEPTSAAELITQASQNFLEQRRDAEAARIEESIAILQRHVDSSRTVIAQAMASADTTSQRIAIAAPNRVPEGTLTTPLATERDEVATALATKQAMVNDLENTRSRRIADLQMQLVSMRERYGPAHPEVLAVQEQIAALAADSPQQAALRGEAETLRRRLLTLGGTPRASTRQSLSNMITVPNTAMNPGRMYAESRLRMAIVDFEDMSDRLKSAKIELETARAAFKYRFTVASPPIRPKGPIKPNVPLLLAGGFIAAICLALFTAVGVDLTNGRLNEAWQVEMLVGTPVLGRLRRA